MDNFPQTIEIALLLLIAFLIGCFIGWLLRAKIIGSGVLPPALGEKNGARPQVLSAPGKPGRDNLKRIRGVGPKLEGQLNQLGIVRFDQIAAWDQKTVERLDNELSFKGRVERDEWIKQAKTLMD